jgi:CMP-N-acetylneuraminic acid synthetase
MKPRPEVLAVIPARGGSKGIPGKNLALLGGRPLIAWSIEAAKKSRHITRVLVSTDSEDIADAARDLGAEVPFLRPARIAGDRAEIGHAFGHVFSRLARRGYVPDVEVHLYPTHPFRNPRLVDGLLSRLISGGLRAVFTARPAQLDRRSLFSMDGQGNLSALYDPGRYGPGRHAPGRRDAGLPESGGGDGGPWGRGLVPRGAATFCSRPGPGDRAPAEAGACPSRTRCPSSTSTRPRT